MEAINNSAKGLGQAMREKYWSELNDTEKIERTRQQVINLMERFQRLEARINGLESNFRTHDHLNGKVVNDQNFIGGSSERGLTIGSRLNSNSNEVYF